MGVMSWAGLSPSTGKGSGALRSQHRAPWVGEEQDSPNHAGWKRSHFCIC